MPNQIFYMQVHNKDYAMSVKDVFARLAAYSGVYDTDIYDLYYGTYSSTGVTAASGTSWTWENKHLPSLETGPRLSTGIVFDFELQSAPWGIACLAVHPIENDRAFIVGVDDSAYSGLWQYDNGVVTRLLKGPAATASTNAPIRVAARLIQFGDSASTTYAAFSLWYNYQLIFTKIVPWEWEFASVGPVWGPAKYGGMGYNLKNLRVTQMGDIIDTVTVDPGETPMSGLQRAIQGYYVKWWMRDRDTLRVRRPTYQGQFHAFDSSVVSDHEDTFDVREMATHVRQVGAYIESEHLDHNLIALHGHRFHIENNPFIITENECKYEAVETLKRLRSQARTVSFTAPANLLLEVEDVIDVLGDYWYVDSITYEISGGDLMMKVTGRYYYGI